MTSLRCLVLSVAVLAVSGAWAQNPGDPPAEKSNAIPAPARQQGEGQGPFKKLVIRGVTLIDGTGSPARGPVDIIIAGNRIAEIKQAGTPGLALKPGRPPKDADYELDASGMYVLPGFVDGKQEPFNGRLDGVTMSYEFVRTGKPMLGRTYYLQADNRTIYALRFTGLRDKLARIRNQTDLIARTFKLK